MVRLSMIETAKDAIAVLGGPSYVGDRLGLHQSTISGWVMQGEIARGWYLHIYASLLAVGYTQTQINPKIFGGLRRWTDLVIPPRLAIERAKRRRAA